MLSTFIMAGRYTVAFGHRDSQRRRVYLLGIVCFVLFVAIMIVIIVIFIIPHFKKPEIRVQFNKAEGVYRDIKCGRLLGIEKKLKDATVLYVFKGIPYARPPVGHLRWKPTKSLPANAKCWHGIYDATKYGSKCSQYNFRSGVMSGKEDCLYLNVWTPAVTNNASLPVAVFLHGGMLMTGSGEIDGVEDLVKTGIVAVSMNYRLNAFGFLTLDVLSQHSSSAVTSNFGFVDQIEALKWVRANIKEFGGNPGKVTLVGIKAGGKSVQGLLASPLANGLFHGAISMSASSVYMKTQSEAAKDNKVFISRSGCDKTTKNETIKCLYSLSDEKILKSIAWGGYPCWSFLKMSGLPTKDEFCGSLSVIDKVVVPSSPLTLNNVKFKVKQNIPLMIGVTAQELESPALQVNNSVSTELDATLNSTLGTFNAGLPVKVKTLYGRRFRNASNTLRLVTLASDVRLVCQSQIYALNVSQSREHTTYYYVITNMPTNPVRFYNHCCFKYAFHGWNSFAMFGFPKDAKNPFVPSSRDLAFKARVQRDVEHFIKNGKPAQKNWLPFPSSYAEYTNDQIEVIVSKMYHSDECKLLMDSGLYKYGWAF